MPAYIIVETDIRDPEKYEQYKQAAPGVIAASGGREARRLREGAAELNMVAVDGIA